MTLVTRRRSGEPLTADLDVVRFHPGTDLTFGLLLGKVIQLVDFQFAEGQERGAADRVRTGGSAIIRSSSTRDAITAQPSSANGITQ